jgi:hypothetical protein
MHVEIRSHNIRMPRAHSQGLAQQVRTAFARLAHRIARIVLDVGAPADAGPAAARECVIEVHLPDGDVMVVRERQRKLGPLLRRALQRAWRTAAAAVISRSEPRSVLRLPAPRPSSPSEHPPLHHQ